MNTTRAVMMTKTIREKFFLTKVFKKVVEDAEAQKKNVLVTYVESPAGRHIIDMEVEDNRETPEQMLKNALAVEIYNVDLGENETVGEILTWMTESEIKQLFEGRN